MTPDHEQVAEERWERWTIYRDDSGYIRAKGSDLLNGPRFAKGVTVVPEARALQAEQEAEGLRAAIEDVRHCYFPIGDDERVAWAEWVFKHLHDALAHDPEERRSD